MKPSAESHGYDAAFYDHQRDASRHAAARILPILFQALPIRSVVDLGCGVGTWLAEARRLGAERTVGVDGPWVEPGALADPQIVFLPRNLEQPVHLDEQFDLAMSLEVAEHLSPDRAASFVQDLCRAANRVLFGAAVPGQGGKNHRHEVWPSVWAECFRDRGYVALDPIRPQVWTEDDLPIHYRQNTLLYVREELADETASAFSPPAREPAMLDVVHPRLYERDLDRLAAPPDVRSALAATTALPGAVIRAIRRRLRF